MFNTGERKSKELEEAKQFKQILWLFYFNTICADAYRYYGFQKQHFDDRTICNFYQETYQFQMQKIFY